MRTTIIIGGTILMSAMLLAQTSQPAQQNSKPPWTTQSTSSASSPTPTPPAKPRLQTPHAKVSGFELAPRGGGGTQVGGATRGIGTPTVLLAPYKGKAYTLTPVFQWSNANRNIHEYTFQLLDSTGTDVLFETKVKGTSLKYPDDAPALTPGGDYFWTAQPTLGLLGEPAEPNEIVILGDPERTQVQAKLQAAHTPTERATIFANESLWYDAIGTYSEMLDANSKDAAARRERANLYEQLPQTEEAAKQDLAAKAE